MDHPLKIKRQSLMFFCFLIMGTASVWAQGNSDFWSRVRYGGALGLGFGNNTLNITAAPAAIYPLNDYVALGSNVSFNYAKFGEDRLTAYGAGLLAYFSPARAVQLSSEFEQLRIHRRYFFNGVEIRDDYWLPVLFLGIGYNTGPVTVGVRYDVLFDEGRSIYADPWVPFIRVFF
jgi:hypothetical protein